MANRKPKRSLTELERKILSFFMENEGSIDTPRGISAWVNENIKQVRVTLEELVQAGYIKAHRTSSTIGYSSCFTQKALAKVVT